LTLILGPPGGGKGTVCKKVVKDFGYNHVSTGDMLRAHVRDGTELGKKAKSFMDSGGLVPDELIINMLSAKLEELGADSRVLLDGFPRTRVQAEALNAKSKVDAVVCLKVKEEEIVRRISDRWIHPASGRTYSQMYSPPKVEGKDDESGEPLVQRDDDKPEAVWERLGQFNSMTTPVIEYYHEQGVLANISGDDAPDLVAKDRRSDAIYQALKPYLERAHTASEK
jgi:adenylate kinase